AVQGRSQAQGNLMTPTPLDFGRQHVLRESCRSAEMLDKPPDARHPDRRVVLWSHRGGVPEGPFRVHYEFYCVTDVRRPTAAMGKIGKALYAAPKRGDYLDAESKEGTDRAGISTLARSLTAGVERPTDQAEMLFRYVDHEIAKEPSVPGRAVGAA